MRWLVVAALCSFVGCGDDERSVGEICEEDADCVTDSCREQSDGAKRCTEKDPSGSAAAGGW